MTLGTIDQAAIYIVGVLAGVCLAGKIKEFISDFMWDMRYILFYRKKRK